MQIQSWMIKLNNERDFIIVERCICKNRKLENEEKFVQVHPDVIEIQNNTN